MKLDINEASDDGLDDDENEGLEFIRRRAVIDQMLLRNPKADFSHAIKKYKWGGEDGFFESKDL